MDTLNVNLARKWRSRNFDQIVGQDLSMRILKNSLYLNHYFPVYLFSGQHGCGKTTTARIFACALNCEKLELFQQDPKQQSVPCLECTSCRAMSNGNHPDFIEIDGASNTGVDNVRHIIDVSTFLPIMSRKKIYLIDEAHMLSKAAFNAFLKILEEPPASVLFMLATTELHKIIDTVRSRSFHLFFRAVHPDVLLKHLEHICTDEHIAYDVPALITIIKQTKGSVRDAINLLEQVRFEGNRVTKNSVLKVLGHSDEETVVILFEKVVSGNVEELLQFISAHSLSDFCTQTLWKSLLEIINACIWISYDLAPRSFAEYQKSLIAIVKAYNISFFNDCLNLLYEYEPMFSKTGSPWHLFEMLLMRMCHAATAHHGQPSPINKTNKFSDTKKNVVEVSRAPAAVSPSKDQFVVSAPKIDSSQQIWVSFIKQIELFDPLLSSIFKQGTYEGFDETKNVITLMFAQEFTFFNEMLESSATVWKPLLASLIGKEVKVNALFQSVQNKSNSIASNEKKFMNTHQATKELQLKKIEQEKVPVKHSFKKQNEKNITSSRTIDISDKDQWKKATMLKEIFSGTVQELQEGSDE